MRVPREEIERNGVIRPKPESLAGEAWAVFDQLGRNFPVATALKIAVDRNLNINNVRTELCRWRKFHGIKMS